MQKPPIPAKYALPDGSLNTPWKVWFERLVMKFNNSGATADRPTTNVEVGDQYYDSTLNIFIYWTGTEWATSGGVPADVPGGGTVNDPPTNDPVPTGITIVDYPQNGKRDITLTWTYTQGDLPAEGLGIAYRVGTGTVVVTDPNITFFPESESYTFFSVPIDGTYRAGIAAYRHSPDGVLRVGNIVQPTISPDWRVNASTNESNLIPQNSQGTNYTLVLGDSGKQILHPASDANNRTFTIPANSSVAFPIGTVITFVNKSANNLTIAITSDTLTYSPDGTTGSRTLTTNKMFTALKIGTTEWII